jgi:type VI secretion system ImpM family protein
MLGSLIHMRAFSWTAVGKHPVAMDYIHLATASVLSQAVGDWMTKGYDQLNRRPQAVQGSHSFRFWIRGAHKGDLLIGLGRDSSDRIGRPYPLLIMGEGGLKGWERLWDQLPLRLDQTWRRMEAIASGRYDDIHSLTAALDRLNGPDEAQHPVATPASERELVPHACRDEMEGTGRTLIDLGPFQTDDPAASVSRRLAIIKDWLREPPLAVFLGGTPRRSYLAVIVSPLGTDDFVRLWST